MIGDGRELGPRAQNSINHGVQCFPRGHARTTAQGSGEPCESSEQLCHGDLEHRRGWVPCATPVYSPHCSQHGLPPAHSDLLIKKKKKDYTGSSAPTLKCWSDSLAWHLGRCEVLGLMSFLATFNALGPPICDMYSHLWAFVQAMDAFYLEGCSSPLSAHLDFCHQCFRFYTRCHLLLEALQGEVPLPFAVCAHVFAFFSVYLLISSPNP